MGDENDDIVANNSVSKNRILVKYANVAALETVGLEPDQFKQFIATTDKDGE